MRTAGSGSAMEFFPARRYIAARGMCRAAARIQNLRSCELPKLDFPESSDPASRLPTAAADTGSENAAAAAGRENWARCIADAERELARTKNKPRHPGNAQKMSAASRLRRLK